jgi:hypothetical protein
MTTAENCRCLVFQYRATHIWIGAIIRDTIKAFFFAKYRKQQYFLLKRNYYKQWLKDSIRTGISLIAVAP